MHSGQRTHGQAQLSAEANGFSRILTHTYNDVDTSSRYVFALPCCPPKCRLDEIGTDEKLPLPEWEWEQHSGVVGGSIRGTDKHANNGGNNNAGDGGLQGRRCSGGSVDAAANGGLPTVIAGDSSSSARHVHARVSAEGRTRVLLISSHKDIRRTIAKFGARQAALTIQAYQCRLVLDKYRR